MKQKWLWVSILCLLGYTGCNSVREYWTLPEEGALADGDQLDPSDIVAAENDAIAAASEVAVVDNVPTVADREAIAAGSEVTATANGVTAPDSATTEDIVAVEGTPDADNSDSTAVDVYTAPETVSADAVADESVSDETVTIIVNATPEAEDSTDHVLIVQTDSTDAVENGNAEVVGAASVQVVDGTSEPLEIATNSAVVIASESVQITTLPKYYKVQPRRQKYESLWTIAGDPAIYNNSYHWRELYLANRNKLPNPTNPNLIQPGMVLEIPSLDGEHREGFYDPNATYVR
jgi:nucleoid-associated protein YgaU